MRRDCRRVELTAEAKGVNPAEVAEESFAAAATTSEIAAAPPPTAADSLVPARGVVDEVAVEWTLG